VCAVDGSHGGPVEQCSAFPVKRISHKYSQHSDLPTSMSAAMGSLVTTLPRTFVGGNRRSSGINKIRAAQAATYHDAQVGTRQ
jgi:hypothetical protein